MKRWFLIAALAAAFATRAAALGIMVPSYFNPGSLWTTMNTAAAQVPLIAILNPDSGPGASQSSGYVAALAGLHHAGGQVLAYIHTSYATRPLTNVEADVDAYVSFYILDGFFVDEMTNDSDTNHLNYYATLYQYIKNKNAGYNVTGNPGDNTQEAYLTQPGADRLMIFENGTGYAGFTPSHWVSKYPADQFVNLPYNVTNTATMSNDVALAVSRNAGWIYLTDDGGSNPYDTLPTYWSAEVALVQSYNATHQPVMLADPAQPADQIAGAGATATFSVAAVGAVPLSYQWFKNSSPLPNATNTTYVSPPVQSTDNGATYYCRITNSISATNSRTATLNVTSSTGTFRTITIDGSFTDWAGVPLAYSQAQDESSVIAYQNIWVCNDSNYLYLRFSIYPPAANPFTGHQNIFVDTDHDGVTGYFPMNYDAFGSELLIQGGAGYQEKNGGFNEGVVTNLNWFAAPASGTNFEMRLSRHAAFASDGTPVSTQNTIALALEAEDASYTAQEYAPTNGSGGLVYTFATALPGPLSIAKTNGNIAISWPGTGTLQLSGSLSTPAWSNMPVSGSSYVTPTPGTQQFFRLTQ